MAMNVLTKLLSIPMVLMFVALPSVAQTVRVITPEELKKFNPKTVETVRKNKQKKSAAKYSVSKSTTSNISLGQGSLLGPSTDISTHAQTKPLTISPQDYVVLDISEPDKAIGCPSKVAGDCRETPYRFLAMTNEGEPLDLSLVFASTKRLRFDPVENHFVGSLFVQLKDLNEPGGTRSIGSRIRVAVSADVDDINPGTLMEFNETNRFQDIAFAVAAPQDPTLVKLTPERLATPQELAFGVSRPALKVSLGKEKILGFGLETTTVTVHFEGASNPPEAAITVSSQTGHLSNNAINADPASRVASTHLRSRGTGKDEITAELAPFDIGSDDIYYEQPWSWLVAVLLGVLAGVGIRLAMRARQSPPTSSLAFNISISICGGIVTAILYALGVNILPIPLPSGFSEGLTFILSALGGWVFPVWLEALGHRGDKKPV